MQNQDEMAGMEEAKSRFIKWGQEGDFLKGTFTSKRQVPDKLKEVQHPGAMQWIYEVLVEAGRYHDIKDKVVDANPTELVPGSFWIVSGKPGIDEGMRNIKIGQIVGFRFTETKPAKQKGFNDNKVIRVYAGAMDPNYMGQSADDVEQAVKESGI
jgi:hypothetical protein